MRFHFIEDHRQEHAVRLMCRVLGVSPSGYYAWRGRAESTRATANRALLADIRRLHERHRGRYGSPRLHTALRAGVARPAAPDASDASGAGDQPARVCSQSLNKVRAGARKLAMGSLRSLAYQWT